MKHARPDYQHRIVDLDGVIPDDEPVFLLRGQDKLAPGLLAQWAEQLLLGGGDIELAKLAHEQAQAMRSYQLRTGRRKIPDYRPPGAPQAPVLVPPEGLDPK
jgi:hypothetical protein